jgi:hypothetical protein
VIEIPWSAIGAAAPVVVGGLAWLLRLEGRLGQVATREELTAALRKIEQLERDQVLLIQRAELTKLLETFSAKVDGQLRDIHRFQQQESRDATVYRERIESKLGRLDKRVAVIRSKIGEHVPDDDSGRYPTLPPRS